MSARWSTYPLSRFGEPAGAASDLFSLGVTLYEAATGRNPFLRPTALQTIAAILDGTPAPLRSVFADFPSDLDAILRRSD